MRTFIGCSRSCQLSPPHQNAPPPVRGGIANRSEYTLPGSGMKGTVSQRQEWFQCKSVRICEPFLVVLEGGRFPAFAKVRPQSACSYWLLRGRQVNEYVDGSITHESWEGGCVWASVLLQESCLRDHYWHRQGF